MKKISFFLCGAGRGRRLPQVRNKYSIANSFRKALETVLTNCPECAKSDCKSWRGRIENSFNKLAAGM